MNRLIKYARFISYRTIIIIEKLSFLVLRIVFCKNGILEKIISNRDKLFTFKFIRELTQVLGIEQAILTSFYL